MIPMEPASLVMERKMLQGIKERAERLREDDGSESHGPGWIRTTDLGIKSPLLYQLSYRPRSSGRGRRLSLPRRPHRLAAQVTALSRP